MRWYDPVSHLARNLSGFEINGLLRYFDTNFYYRQPIAGNIISTGQGQLADEIRYLKRLHNQSVKAVLLGPYSFAKMTLNSTDLEFGEYALKIAGILNKEIINFVKAGADYIQIDEPCFVREPGDYKYFSSLIAAACENISGSVTILSFYFGDCGKIINRLNEIPVDMIGFDFTYSPNLLERLSSDGFSKPLAFGVIDGRNTRLESADAIAKILEKPLSKMNFESCLITSSCGLEFLPRQYAIKKLRAISKTAKLLNG